MCAYTCMLIIYFPSILMSGRDRMVVGFTTSYAISPYHHSPLMLWVQISTRTRCTTLCDKVCQWLVAGWLFSPDPPVSSTNKSIKTDRHDITEILLKVALNTINQPKGGRRVKGVKVWNQLKIWLLYIKGFDCKIYIMAKTLDPF